MAEKYIDELRKCVIPHRIINKLKDLNCPIGLLENKGDWWIQNILFSRPEYYTKLLRWIESNFHESCWSTVPEGTITKYIFQGTKAEGIGFPKDMEGDINTMVNAWEKLIDICLLQKRLLQAEPPVGNTEARVDDACMALKRWYEHDIVKLDELAEKSVGENFFPSGVADLNRDVQLAISDYRRINIEKLEDFDNFNYNALDRKQTDLLNKIGQEARELQTMSSGRNFENANEKSILEDIELRNVEEKLRATKASLLQLTHEFREKNQSQFEEYLGKEKAVVPDLGESFHKTCAKAQTLTELLEKFHIIENSSTEIQSVQRHMKPFSRKNYLPGFLDETEKAISLLKKV